MKRNALETNHANLSLAIIPATDGLAIHENPAFGYLAALRTDAGRRVQSQALASVARLLRHDLTNADHLTAIAAIDWHKLNNATVKAISTRLATMTNPQNGKLYSVNTANRKLDAVRGVLRQAWLNGLMTRDEYERAVEVERVPGQPLLRGRDVSAGEMLAVFLNCRQDQTIVGRRDAALLALLFGSGIRRAECAALKISDWNTAENEITIERGKGGKARIVPLPDGTVKALNVWLEARQSYTPNDALLCPLAKGGKIENRQMTTQAIWKAVQKRAEKTKITMFSPHDCRRTFIGDLLDSGADLSIAATLAGHSDPKQTKGYDRRSNREMRTAVNKLQIPFV